MTSSVTLDTGQASSPVGSQRPWGLCPGLFRRFFASAACRSVPYRPASALSSFVVVVAARTGVSCSGRGSSSDEPVERRGGTSELAVPRSFFSYHRPVAKIFLSFSAKLFTSERRTV